MNYYFIDFENVHSDGFVGIEGLGKNDVLYLMYTEYCKVFSIDVLEKICRHKINLEVYKVGSGTKNALDFQLASFMGYIIAQNDDKENVFYIVSKDTGFNPLIDFWKEKGVNVKRIQNFSSSPKEIKSAQPAKPVLPANSDESPKTADLSVSAPILSASLSEPIKPALSLNLSNPEPPAVHKNPAKSKSKKSNIDKAEKEEILNFLSEEEYSDRILEIINSYKTKVSIKNGFDKEFRDSQKSSVIYKKLKPLLKEKKKT